MAVERLALVTGGCGFIGVNLARALRADGWRLRAFDNLTTGSAADGEAAGFDDLVEGDVRDGAALAAAATGVDAVVHLAAHTSVIESVEDPRTDLDTNVWGVFNALEAARAHGVRQFVFASSNAPLGEVDPPASEHAVPRPMSPYGASKLAGEGLCSAYGASYGVRAVALRFSNVYGPYSYHKGSVVARFMKDALERHPLTIYGDGLQTRDFVYVDDLCQAILAALDADVAGETIHVGSGTETTVLDVARAVAGLFPQRVEIRHEPARAGEILRNFSDISKARAVLGYRPSVALDEGLKRTAAWFEAAYR